MGGQVAEQVGEVWAVFVGECLAVRDTCAAAHLGALLDRVLTLLQRSVERFGIVASDSETLKLLGFSKALIETGCVPPLRDAVGRLEQVLATRWDLYGLVREGAITAHALDRVSASLDAARFKATDPIAARLIRDLAAARASLSVLQRDGQHGDGAHGLLAPADFELAQTVLQHHYDEDFLGGIRQEQLLPAVKVENGGARIVISSWNRHFPVASGTAAPIRQPRVKAVDSDRPLRTAPTDPAGLNIAGVEPEDSATEHSTEPIPLRSAMARAGWAARKLRKQLRRAMRTKAKGSKGGRQGGRWARRNGHGHVPCKLLQEEALALRMVQGLVRRFSMAIFNANVAMNAALQLAAAAVRGDRPYASQLLRRVLHDLNHTSPRFRSRYGRSLSASASLKANPLCIPCDPTLPNRTHCNPSNLGRCDPCKLPGPSHS